jgi:hypothetical protein
MLGKARTRAESLYEQGNVMSERPPPTESELVELVRSIDVRAPQRLHERIDAMVAAASPAHPRGADGKHASVRRRRPTLRWGLAAAAPALCALAIVLALTLSGGGSTFTLQDAVALTLRPPTLPAPSENPHAGAQLMAHVDGVAFPYWEESFGWRATGARVDHLGGRTVTTVFYAASDGRWLGYAIVAGMPAPDVGGGVLVRRDGTVYRMQLARGARVVTWTRDGHLCVVAGHGVSRRALLALASWRGRATAS